MALVGEIVAKFKAETSEYLGKIEQAKEKNKELAKSLIETAGSAEKAMATLQVAKQRGGLGEFGIDPRQVSGIVKELKEATKGADEFGKQLKASAQQAGGFGDIADSLRMFSSGDVLAGVEKFKKGLSDVHGSFNGSNGLIKSAYNFNAGLALNVAIIGVIGAAFEDVTKKAGQAVEQYRSGTLTLRESSGELARGIPILGSFVKGWDNVKEMITGNRAESEKLLATETAIAAAIDKQIESRKRLEKFVGKFQQDTADKQRETQIGFYRNSGLNDTADKEEAKFKIEQAMRQAMAEIDTAFDERKKALDEQRKALEKGNQSTAGVQKQIDAIAAERDKLIQARRDALAMEAQDEIDFKKQARDKAKAEDAKQAAEKKADEQRKVAEQAKKEADDKAKRAEALKDSARTTVEAFNDRIREAAKLLKGADLDKYLTKDAKSLLEEQKKLKEPTKVYDTPNVSELRGGQTLYTAPTQIAQKSLERLGEIKTELEQLKEVAKGGGVVIEEIGN